MLIGRFLLFIIMLSTFLIAAALTTNLTTTNPLITANHTECQENCSIDFCSKYLSLTRNCSKLIRDQCDCCTVCLRTENEICGGHLNIYGLCEQDLICYKSNLSESIGRCVKACFKFQCLRIDTNNKTICQCANRRLPCHVNLTENTCDDDLFNQQERQLSYFKANHDEQQIINCSNIVCKTKQSNQLTCPSDSHFIEDHTSLIRTSLSSSTNLSSICCESRGQCRCSTCPKTICEENSIIQIFRTGNPNLPGQCCDQFNCITNSKQCHHDKKIYNDNETWSIDLCTTCTCRAGLVDCSMVQCPTYTHCGYMYKPENECCPKCGGCLNDQRHVQHMNSTWFESNGCMRCWCENGRSRCLAEGCIAPPCENPRQIPDVCCPVCENSFDDESHSQEIDSIIAPKISSTTVKCPILEQCSLVCEHGLAKDEQGCLQCTCSAMSCPLPLCTLKFDRLSKQYCSCSSPSHLSCGQLNCDKHCPYNYSMDSQTGCPTCECNPCPQLICTKNCTYGLKRNEVGCPICVCKSNINSSNQSKAIDVLTQSWPKRCHSGLFSYSNGEIWFDGCRQCFCHKGEQLCALISCPIPKCSQPILLPNRCCPSCPEIVMLPEPIPSSQVCYASQYVTGEELEFDKCTKCLCLHNIAFCSVALCPPLACSSPIYDDSLCCPICPPKQSDKLISIDAITNLHDDICILDDGHMKHAGELWKHDDCRSCHCPRGGNGQIECFSQACEQNLPCSNPILKKGQCCPVCLPPTAAVAVCIFNHVQYRSGEHWNVSECHSCECSYGTIVCHQHQCPSLTCVHTLTLTGHCCPICRDQLGQNRFSSMKSHLGLTILVIFSILIFVLIFIIILLLCILLRGGRQQSLRSSNQLPTVHNRSPIISFHSSGNNSKATNRFSDVKYDLISRTNNNNNHHPKSDNLSSSHIPLTSLEQTSTHSMIGTTTTTMTTTATTTSSSNHELEPGTWTEDDPMLQSSVSTSNEDDDDDDVEHEILANDHDESRQQQTSHHQIQMTNRPPTIMYV